MVSTGALQSFPEMDAVGRCELFPGSRDGDVEVRGGLLESSSVSRIFEGNGEPGLSRAADERRLRMAG